MELCRVRGIFSVLWWCCLRSEGRRLAARRRVPATRIAPDVGRGVSHVGLEVGGYAARVCVPAPRITLGVIQGAPKQPEAAQPLRSARITYLVRTDLVRRQSLLFRVD